MGFVKEFREFALRGNVMDLAVGVIIGGAFGTIINSMVKDIIMPVVGIAGKADFSNMYLGLKPSVQDAIDKAGHPALEQARALGPVLAYGSFITVVINFAILAFCVFLMVKAMNILMRKKVEATPAAPPAPSPQEVLLTQIRDILRERRV